MPASSIVMLPLPARISVLPLILARCTDTLFSIHDWALSAMQWAVSEEIITGRPSGALDPRGFATRAEVATMMMRFLS